MLLNSAAVVNQRISCLKWGNDIWTHVAPALPKTKPPQNEILCDMCKTNAHVLGTTHTRF